MINPSQLALFELLKSSLFGYQISLPQDTDWDAVLQEAKDQAVVRLVEKSVSVDQASNWKKLSIQYYAHFFWMLQVQKELVELFDANGIQIVILKGYAAALYYPDPSQRTMGDIDFLVPQDRFLDSKKLMENAGYIEKYGDERHIGFFKRNVLFEMHHHFSSLGLNVEPAILEGFKHAKRECVLGVQFPMLPTLENGLVFLTHIRQHLLEDAYSLGLRQIIDWMMYVHVNHNKELDDGKCWDNEIIVLAKEYHLDKLAIITTYLCKKWLGLPAAPDWCTQADEATADELLEIVMSNGNFGIKHDKVDNDIKQAVTLYQQAGVFRRLQVQGLKNWKAAEKYRALKPFAWLYQLCRVLGFGLSKAFEGTPVLKQMLAGNKKSAFLKRLGL